MTNKIFCCFLLFIVVLVSSCASTSSIQQLSENTFIVSANASPARGGEAGARDMALQAANKHCALASKQIEVIQMKTGRTHSIFAVLEEGTPLPTVGAVTVTFMCK